MNLNETLTRALPRFLRRCDAASTHQAYDREIRRFLAWVSPEPTEEVLYDYRDHLRSQGLGATTVRWRTTVIRRFLLFALRRGILDRDLVADYKPPKGETGFSPRVLSRDELDQLLGSPDRRTPIGRRDAVVLIAMGVGGLRAGEVCRLDGGDVRLSPDGVIMTVNGKGRKSRPVHLPVELVSLVRSYLRMWPSCRKPSAPFFKGGRSMDRRITVAGVDYLVRRAATSADLPAVHAHALRHTAATLTLESGTPIHVVQAQLGHSSITTTMRYLHAST